jgi:hypothetical protein
MKSNWRRVSGYLYVSKDNRFAIRHVDYKAWGIVENDGSIDWEYGSWKGSTYPTLKSAMDSVVEYTTKV